LDQLVADFQAKKDEAKARGADSTAHFTWSVRGGKALAAAHQVGYDSYRASATTALGREFLHRFVGQQSVTFATKMHGDELCMVACEYWMAKMVHWLGVWAAKGQGAYSFTSEDLRSFEEPEAFRNAVANASGAALKRLEELRALRPRCG